MALRLLVADSPAEREAARGVEGQVFLDAFGNTQAEMEQEYGRYDGRSRFIAVIDDADGRAVGAVRLIVPDGTGEVKSLSDAANGPWHLSTRDVLGAAGLAGRTVWDVATLAVDQTRRPGASRGEVTLALCHGIYRYACDSGVDGLVTILDDRVLRVLRAIGVPWVPMAGATSRYYLGSPASTPCVCWVEDCARSIRGRRPDLAPAVLNGVFGAILLDPDHLLPGRGVPLSPATPPRPAEAAAMAPRVGWRPPAYRRGVEPDPAEAVPAPSS